MSFFEAAIQPLRESFTKSFSEAESKIKELEAQLAAIPKSDRVQVGIERVKVGIETVQVGTMEQVINTGCRSLVPGSVRCRPTFKRITVPQFGTREVFENRPIFENRFNEQERELAASIQNQINEIKSQTVRAFADIQNPDLADIIKANKNVIIPVGIIAALLILAR